MTGSKSNVVNLKSRRCETRHEALERLFKEHRAALRAFLLKRIGHEAELEEILQDVFIRLAGMEDLQTRLPLGDTRRNRNFIFTVANNMVVDLERRKSLQKEYHRSQCQLAEEQPCREPDPEVIIAARQGLSLVKAAIMELKPTWRKAFIMSRYNYMSYKEIAEEMGVSVKQVENYMTNALIKLREATSNPPPRNKPTGTAAEEGGS